MGLAARISDKTSHGGKIMGNGEPSVIIGGLPAAVVSSQHVCGLPPLTHQPTISNFATGSYTVLIGGLPALRTGDKAPCGAAIIEGEPTVIIG